MRIKTKISKVMLIERNSYLQKLIARRDNGRVKVITGIRRCGKSVLLFDIYKEYLKKTGIKDNQIIEVHLDEKVNAEYRNPMNLDNYLHKRIGRKRSQLYVLIDEIQEVEPIQNPWLPDNKEAKITFVDVLIGLMNKKNVDVYVTGSNSRMLSKDVMTQFRDRGDEIHVNPLTYREFYSSYQGDRRDAWGAFCTFGGLPKVATEATDEDRTAYLQDLMARTYLRDVVERNKIQKDESLLREMLLVVASSVGSLTNPKKLEQTFQSVRQQKLTDDTISRYLDYCEEAYLIKKAFRYDIKGRKYIGTPLKYYFTDVGLRNALLNFRQSEENHLMENIIFNELCVRGFSVDVGIVQYNYKDEEGKSKRRQVEVDFVVNKTNLRYYIQSAFAIPDDEKRNQETNSLRRIGDSYQRIVVQRDLHLPYYDENGIYYIGLEDFLLKFIDEM
jgi:predicted AAA+ superfamily ATPase